MNIAISINRATDISLAQILYTTRPKNVNIKIVTSSFNCGSEYNWVSGKSLQRWLQNEDIVSLKKFFGKDLIHCDNLYAYKSIIKQFSVGIFPGREPFILKTMPEKIICISAVRDYFNRYLDLINVRPCKIVLNSKNWIDKDYCGLWGMGTKENYEQDYKFIQKHRKDFIIADPYADYVNILNKEKIRMKYSIPMNKKVALLSLRRGDPDLTFFKSDESFFKNNIDAIKNLKSRGYYIVSRRRISYQDTHVRRKDSAENTRYQEFDKLIDLDMTGWSSFPNTIWEACAMSDIMLLCDMSGIARREASIMKTPVLIPSFDKEIYEKNLLKSWDPAMVDLHNSGLLARNLSEASTDQYKQSMTEFNERWHQGNSCTFWQSVI